MPPKVNASAQILQEFGKRVADYIKLRKSIKAPKLQPTDSPDTILHHEHQLAEQIRKARPGASRGDIFAPGIAAEFRRLIEMTMQGPDAGAIRASLQRAEPVRLKALRVNHGYPRSIPLQSTPPSLLLNLPQLPEGLDYRVVGQALVLRDTSANLIVDFIPNAIP
jgi:hypothetical protein